VPADKVTHGTDVEESRVRTGPRHAAPKKPLFTRFHMPAGKAIAMAAMPTAVIVGMGFTSSLALADSGGSTATTNAQKADEYKDCVAALEDSSASPSPSASASSSESADKATPSPSASADTSKDSGSGKTSSSDSGSDDKATPSPSASASSSKDTSSGDTATPSPSASASSGGGGLLDDIGDAITGIFTGGGDSSTPSASPTPSASASESKDSSSSGSSGSSDSGASDTVKDTAKKVTDTVGGTVKDTTDTATKAAEEATKAAEKAAAAATSSASPSASPTVPANCEAATDKESGVDNKVPVADDPWYLNASYLDLNGADYKGIVEVKTASGATKKVLKYVISGGTKIGDLHQTVKDKQQNKTYHVQAAKGSESTITGGTTTMYTESISGNLLGLIHLTFTPDSPPPVNIPWIYMTNVKVVQAAQFGGTLTVPGMHVYTTDGIG
jgi:hypothetical protein